jgi:hypothetical protein
LGINYTAIERAVSECAFAGCETIWIVGHRDMQPLIRHRLGTKIVDPITLMPCRRPQSHIIKPIQIYYVPIHPSDKERRDCLSYSVLYGALTAFLITAKISKWVTPDKYYASFPWGAYNENVAGLNRAKISSKENFSFSYNDRTIRDNFMTGFTFGPDDWKRANKVFKELSKERFFYSEDSPKIKYNFPLDKIFVSVKMQNVVELESFYQIDSWEGYKKYISSDLELIRPSFLRNMKDWTKIPTIGDEDDITTEV